jgi:hypothetical protein
MKNATDFPWIVRQSLWRRIPKVTRNSDDAPRHPLLGALKGLVRVMPGTGLTAPAWADSIADADGERPRLTRIRRKFQATCARPIMRQSFSRVSLIADASAAPRPAARQVPDHPH